MAKRDLRAEIRRDLLNQLDVAGATGEYYSDLAEDYMSLWDTKCALVTDIKKRGAKVEVVMTGGLINMKTNDSLADLLKVNMQMLKILDYLSIKPTQANGGEGDEM